MTKFKLLSNWSVKPPFYYGWLILAMTALGTFGASGLTQGVFGGIQGFIISDSGWNPGPFALTVTLGTWASGLISPIVGRIVDNRGPRWLMPIGAITVGSSLLLLSRVNSFWHFAVAYIIGRGLSNPILIGTVPRTVTVNFFHRRRNMALAITSIFRPVAVAINLQIILFITTRVGWQVAFRYLGILNMCLIIPLIAIMRRQPEDVGQKMDTLPTHKPTLPETHYANDTTHQPLNNVEEISWSAREALHTSTYWMLTIAETLSMLSASAIGFSLVPYLHSDLGLPQSHAVGILSLGVVLSVSNLLWAYLADILNPRTILICAQIIISGLSIYLLTISSLPAAYIFGVLSGLTTGASAVLNQMLIAQYFGRGSFGTITGFSMPLKLGALGIGPTLAMVIKEATGTYVGLYIGLAIISFISVLFIYKAKPPIQTRMP